MSPSLPSPRLCIREAVRIALFALIAVGLSAAVSTGAYAQDASLLKDINAGSANASPSGFAEVDVAGTPVSLFAATKDDTGRELWRTDGTAEGTELVLDLNPNTASANPTELVVMDGVAYFVCTTEKTGTELCRSDGTATGTYVVRDIRSGTIGSAPQGLTVVGRQLFFFASDGTTGFELWASDGTEKGTRLVKDVRDGSMGLNRDSNGNTISANGRYDPYHAGTTTAFYFLANDGSGLEVWRSDGSANGTVPATAINPQFPYPNQFTGVGSQLFFVATTPDTGQEVWVTDGKTTSVLEIGPDGIGSDPQTLAAVGSEAYFFAVGMDETTNLYRSDGTQPTQVLDGTTRFGTFPWRVIHDFNGRAVFSWYNPSTSRSELWISDGTPGGTSQISTVRPQFEVDRSRAVVFDARPVTLGDHLYFRGELPDLGAELWRTDGTAAGTELVEDVRSGSSDALLTDIGRLGTSQVLFGANDGSVGTELWVVGSPPPPATPEVAIDVRVARAAAFCSDPTDPTTCSVIGGGRSDTLAIGPLEDVLVRYVVRNAGSVTLTEVDITDRAFGPVASESVALAPFDSLVVNRIYDAPAAAGLLLSGGDVAAREVGGATDTDGETYGIDVLEPEVRLDVRVAEAARFCSDLSDPSTCSVIGGGRSDTLAVEPVEEVLVRYVIRNAGSTTLTEVDLTDEQQGAILETEPVSISAFDSLVVNRIYTAPAASGLSLSRGDVTARDAGGNADTAVDLYGIDVLEPEVRMNVRVARAANFCSDLSDPTTCAVVGGGRSDTLAVEPLEEVLVRYVIRNAGSTTLTEVDLTDQQQGPILETEPVSIPAFDSLVVNRIYDAPAAAGLRTSRGEVTVRDAGGNADTAIGPYGIDVQPPEVRLDLRVARAADFCSDVTDPSTCGVISPFADNAPRPDTVFALAAGERYLVRYIVRNTGSTTLQEVDLTDERQGSVLAQEPVSIAPFDSAVVNRIYTAPLLAGIQGSKGEATVRDAGGNPDTDVEVYGVQTDGLAFRTSLFVGLASRFCTDVSNPLTCQATPLKSAAHPSALGKATSEPEVVLYTFVNTGTVEFVEHTLLDNVVGTVFEDERISVAPLDSIGRFRIYQDGTTMGQDRTSTWTATSVDGEVLAVSSTEVALPVELARFGAEIAGRRVTLEWATASEENNAGFQVQRFNAATATWQALAFVAGAGTTTETTAYRYEVGEMEPDVYRFRLRQIDVDGRFAVSPEVTATVAVEGAYRFTKPAPHPVQTTSRFSLTVREAQRVRIDVYDLLGRRVATVFDGMLEANRKEDLPFTADRLPSGIYFLRAVGERFAATERVTVVR